MNSTYYMVFLLLCLIIWSCTSLPANQPDKIKKFTDPRDGEKYTYIEIENRYWMRENIRYNVEGSKLNPDNPSPLYGRLYNWEQAQKACPEGWRLSTNGDWQALERPIIPTTKEQISQKKCRGKNAAILKSKKYWTPAGTDSLKMNILPTGDYVSNSFNNLNKTAGFWTSTSHIKGGLFAESLAYYRIFSYDWDCIYYGTQNKYNFYYSCRCVKSLENNPFNDL